MSRWPYSDEELENYFNDADARSSRKPGGRVSRFWHSRMSNDHMARAATVLSFLVIAAVGGVLLLSLYFATLVDELPSLRQIENPEFQLATIAYTADGKELTRYALKNRAWATYEEISPHVINALWATEDHRFYAHWGIDMVRTMAIPIHILLGDPQGGSTISQQLARNLYNEEIGRKVTVSRKLKEMVTAVQLERRYTKNEIIVMYLNTVTFGPQQYGIEAASRSFFGKSPLELNELEAATLVGMLKATTTYNPIHRPENSKNRRNVVLSQMVKRGVLTEEFYAENRDEPVEAEYHSSAITKSIAPHFAAEVERWLKPWAEQNGVNLYEDGLTIYTTLDSRMQEHALAVTDSLMPCLQAAVDFEWSTRSRAAHTFENACRYQQETIPEPWGMYWQQNSNRLDQFIRNTDRYRRLRSSDGMKPADALSQLRSNREFVDSLKTAVTRLETGFVAMDPQTGYIKAWVGGRKLEADWYDHVSIASRQPGSAFKPFVYTAAIDEGWAPYHTYTDDVVRHVDTAGNVWEPGNFGDTMTGQPMTLRDGLAQSKNTISAKLILELGPSQAAFYARRMGIESPLDEVPSLALGTSDVTLLEMTKAYSTLANGGLLYQPTLVSRIEDRSGNVLYEAQQAPREALSEATAYTMVDMLRAVLRAPGSGQRMGGPDFGLYGQYDLAGKTGTTQNAADTWFMMMHPDLVMGSWIGFNDPAVHFRTNYWGQGSHTALYQVGHFFSRIAAEGDDFVSRESRFPAANLFGRSPNAGDRRDSLETPSGRGDPRRVDW